MGMEQTRRRIVSVAGTLALLCGLPGLSASADGVATVPLYRLYDAKNGINFYTTNKARRTQAISNGWVPEGIAGHCLPSKAPGTVPLMAVRLLEPGRGLGSIGSHYVFVYSTNIDEITNLQNHGWTPESATLSADAEPVCWVGPARVVVGSRLGDTVPLHRLFHPPALASGDDHFYTIDEDAMGSAVRDAGYRYEHVEAQLWAQPTTVGAPSAAPPPIHVPRHASVDPPAGCTRFLGRDDELLCRTDVGLSQCEGLRTAGRIKVCRRTRR